MINIIIDHLKYLDQKATDAIMPRLRDNKKTVIGVSTAVTLTVLGRYLYRALTVPPKKLGDLPCITYIDLLKSVCRGERIYDMKKRLTLPLLDKADGVFLEPTHVGWQFRSTNPEVNKFLMSDIDLFTKADDMFGAKGSLICKFIGGNHVGSLDGDEWKRHRKILNPAFHRALPINTFGQLAQKTFLLMEKLGLENLCVTDFCGRMTLDAIGIAGFGFDFECVSKVENEWLEGYDNIKEKMVSFVFILFQVFDDQLKWMFPSRVKAHKQLDHLLARIDSIIVNRRKELEEARDHGQSFENSIHDPEKDILTLMLEAELMGEGNLTNLELRRNITGFFFAGHETTAVALSFAIAQMGRNKSIQDKARQEVLNILGDGPEDVLPSKEDIKEMKYLDAIIKETLRLNTPIINTLTRLASRDIAFKNYFIPKGTVVDIDILSTHLSEANWRDALEFVPERFLGASDPTSTKDGLYFSPFGYGSHSCPGMNFSFAEQKVFLSMLLRKFEWELPEDSIHKDGCVAEGYGSIKPAPLHANFRRRY